MLVEFLHDSDQPLAESQRLWRYMKLSTLLLLLEGTAFLPSVATLRSGDAFEGISSVDAPWMFSALRKVHGREEMDRLHLWLKSKASQTEATILDSEHSVGPGTDAIWDRSSPAS